MATAAARRGQANSLPPCGAWRFQAGALARAVGSAVAERAGRLIDLAFARPWTENHQIVRRRIYLSGGA